MRWFLLYRFWHRPRFGKSRSSLFCTWNLICRIVNCYFIARCLSLYKRASKFDRFRLLIRLRFCSNIIWRSTDFLLVHSYWIHLMLTWVIIGVLREVKRNLLFTALASGLHQIFYSAQNLLFLAAKVIVHWIALRRAVRRLYSERFLRRSSV